MKERFILHLDSLGVLDELSNEQAGILFKAMKSYHEGKDFELDAILKIAFAPFKNQFVRDMVKYEETCERNRLNGIKGGAPKKPTRPQLPPNAPDNDRDSKSDNKNDSKNDSVVFSPTQLLEFVKESEEWKTRTSATYKTDIKTLEEFAAVFCAEQTAKEKVWANRKDAISHLLSAFKISKPKNKPVSAIRRYIDSLPDEK